jgi:response regulator RpfG family c-di-GMP phosphodiesterase
MVNTILLLDDNTATNYIHKKFISRSPYDAEVVSFEMGKDAIAYLEDKENPFPELIFVDINMPTMSAWEFFGNFRQIKRKEKENTICIILTTSLSPEDTEIVKDFEEVNDIMMKPLNLKALEQVFSKFFT